MYIYIHVCVHIHVIYDSSPDDATVCGTCGPQSRHTMKGNFHFFTKFLQNCRFQSLMVQRMRVCLCVCFYCCMCAPTCVRARLRVRLRLRLLVHLRVRLLLLLPVRLCVCLRVLLRVQKCARASVSVCALKGH